MSLSFGTVLKAWIVFFLVATVGGMILGGVLGGVIGAVLGASGVPIKQLQIISFFAGLIVGIPLSFFTYWWTIKAFILNSKAVRQSYDPSKPY